VIFPVLLWYAINDTLKAVERSLCGVSDDDLKRALKDSDEFQCDYERKTEELKGSSIERWESFSR
jgi:hypothetical protein